MLYHSLGCGCFSLHTVSAFSTGFMKSQNLCLP